jgi:hypothetical protein
MRELGLVENQIWYKCDAFTHLNLDSKNPYGIKASLYGSKDVLDAKPDKKSEGFFYKKKDHGD